MVGPAPHWPCSARGPSPKTLGPRAKAAPSPSPSAADASRAATARRGEDRARHDYSVSPSDADAAPELVRRPAVLVLIAQAAVTAAFPLAGDDGLHTRAANARWPLPPGANLRRRPDAPDREAAAKATKSQTVGPAGAVLLSSAFAPSASLSDSDSAPASAQNRLPRSPDTSLAGAVKAGEGPRPGEPPAPRRTSNQPSTVSAPSARAHRPRCRPTRSPTARSFQKTPPPNSHGVVSPGQVTCEPVSTISSTKAFNLLSY